MNRVWYKQVFAHRAIEPTAIVQPDVLHTSNIVPRKI